VVISPAQSLAARGLLNLSQVKLARLANVSGSMLRDFEKGRMPTIDDLEAIRRALEAKGVEFTNGDEPGVRLRKEPTKRATNPNERLSIAWSRYRTGAIQLKRPMARVTSPKRGGFSIGPQPTPGLRSRNEHVRASRNNRICRLVSSAPSAPSPACAFFCAGFPQGTSRESHPGIASLPGVKIRKGS
jgi:transcriptional regulator with XRE-family HTH domain